MKEEKKKLLLIVEDNPLLVGMYKGAFERAGFEVIFAHDGQSGLRLARENIPSVVLLDVPMPKMNGLDVLKELKSEEKTKMIKVIMLTILGQEDVRQKAQVLGADDFMTKSELKLSEIVERVSSLFK